MAKPLTPADRIGLACAVICFGIGLGALWLGTFTIGPTRNWATATELRGATGSGFGYLALLGGYVFARGPIGFSLRCHWTVELALVAVLLGVGYVVHRVASAF